jgi:phosphoribosyl-AMP cyclohydrolase
LIPAIAQDAKTGEVLMLAYMNEEAFNETLKTGKAVYFSRSRNKLWRKGEESGHFQIVRELFIDCDADTVLVKVEQIGGAACHEGFSSCFFRKLNDGKTEVIGSRIFDPSKVYKK